MITVGGEMIANGMKLLLERSEPFVRMSWIINEDFYLFTGPVNIASLSFFSHLQHLELFGVSPDKRIHPVFICLAIFLKGYHHIQE